MLGRESALAELRRLIGEHRTHLITLTGAGGTGKSRLALELAAELGSLFNKEWFVDLTRVQDPRLVPSAVAQALGVQEAGDKSLNAILEEVLSEQPGLLILDNFEHVMGAAEFVAELLGACPELVIIATSREALGLRAEHVYFVEPLPVPDLDNLYAKDAIRQVPSVLLFEQRARARRAGFQLTDESLAAVAGICVRLDGLPLAIELAAAQAAILTPAAIHKRLIARAPLIGTGYRDLPARHQTLESTVGWSYDLLEPSERAVFRLCGVFSGGFTAEALESVAHPLLPGLDALTSLGQLVTKSLVRVGEGATAEPRFWLLETIRQYAIDQLALNDQLAEARARHAAYFVERAERLYDSLRGPDMAAALDEVASDYGNFRAVFQWASETGNFAEGLRLAGSLYRFWLARGPLSEARSWLEAALAQSQMVPKRIRAAALNAAGVLAGVQHDHGRARDLFEESLELLDSPGDTSRKADVYLNLGLIAHVTADRQEAEHQFERAHQLYVELEDRSGQAKVLASRARAAREQNDLAAAMRLAEESLSLFQSVGDNWGTANQLANVGYLRVALGDGRGAGDAFRKALTVWWPFGNAMGIAECLDGLANVLVARQPRRAAQLLGAAEGLRERPGALVAAVEQQRYRELVARVKSHLSDDTFLKAWREGRELSMEKAMRVALQDDHSPDQTAGVLSQREQEIALLIARGYSNNAIAESLVVSIKTVETHVQHIFRKLGVKRRAEIAAWAVREGLIS